MRVVGSPQGQTAFNQLKGSTPIHTEVDISSLDPVTAATVDDYNTASVRHDTTEVGTWTGDVARGLFYGAVSRESAIETLKAAL